MKKSVSPKAMKSHVKKDVRVAKELIKDDKKLIGKLSKKKK